MVDRLSDLPVATDAVTTPQEMQVLTEHFGGGGGGGTGTSSLTFLQITKLTIYAVVLFIVLSNSWTDSGLNMVSSLNGAGAGTTTTVKCVIFIITFALLAKYAI
jgi:hypothetical protein